MTRPIPLPPVYTDHQMSRRAAELDDERYAEVRWWIYSDSLGSRSTASYDFWMSNVVEGPVRIQFITGGYPRSHPDLITWIETTVWHDWDRSI